MEAGAPLIQGTVGFASSLNNISGSFAMHPSVSITRLGGEQNHRTNVADFNASRSSTIYGNSSSITPLSLTNTFLIRY